MSKSDKQDNVFEERLTDAVAKAVEKAVTEAVPMAAMAAQRVQQQVSATGFRGVPKQVDFGPRCSTCGQYEVACKSQHVMMIVAPRNPRRFASFPGITINGITYASPDMHTPIPVPAENEISHKIKLWEEGEEDLRNGRTVTHDSGVLSGRPGAVNQTREYAGAGFRG